MENNIIFLIFLLLFILFISVFVLAVVIAISEEDKSTLAPRWIGKYWEGM